MAVTLLVLAGVFTSHMFGLRMFEMTKAKLGGIVPSNGTSYSGGVENFPRFLEHWGGRKLAYNGSMVVMFYSLLAIAPWGGSDVYSPPTRQWTFDLNFMDPLCMG